MHSVTILVERSKGNSGYVLFFVGNLRALMISSAAGRGFHAGKGLVIEEACSLEAREVKFESISNKRPYQFDLKIFPS